MEKPNICLAWFWVPWVETDKAYDVLYSAAWSGFTVPKAMSKLAAIDGRRKDYAHMMAHAVTALESAARHPLASTYAALAQWKMGNTESAMAILDKALRIDPLNDLAAYAKLLVEEKKPEELQPTRRSDFGQIALDIAYDLADAGFITEALALLKAVKNPTTPMVGYTAAYYAEMLGEDGSALRVSARPLPHSHSISIPAG